MPNPTNSERDALLREAMAATRRAVPLAEADRERPVFHFGTPAQWMNDPNGPLFYRGWYHIFYQFNPYGDAWGNMHWGHARSRNLVDWEHLPVALWPSKSAGEAHVYSGSAGRDEKGKPVLFYTSIGDSREPEQWTARPENDTLITFAKPGTNPLTLAAHNGEDIKEWRDPFIFTDAGKTLMLVGGGKNGRGVVLLYEAESAALAAWKYRGVFFEHPDRDLPNVECPNVVRIGRDWVLLTSTHGKVEYFVGAFDSERGAFTMRNRGIIMDGAYASQLVAGKSEAIFLAWFQPPHKAGWAGCLTLPSRLSVSPNGVLLCRPLPALASLREKRTAYKNLALRERLDLSEFVSGNTGELKLTLQGQNAKAFGLRLRVSPDGARAVEIRYAPQTRTLRVSGRNPVVLPVFLSEKPLDVHIFLDKTVVEVYAAGGAVTQITAAQNARPEDTGLHLFAEGGPVTVASLDVYQYKSAHFDKSAFL